VKESLFGFRLYSVISKELVGVGELEEGDGRER